MTHLWLPERPLVLASGSPTRRHLLEAAGLDVEVVIPNVDERGIEADSGPLAPADLARRLALAKARAVAEKARDRIVLAADQVLACDGEVFHKSASLDAAKHQLSRLIQQDAFPAFRRRTHRTGARAGRDSRRGPSDHAGPERGRHRHLSVDCRP